MHSTQAAIEHRECWVIDTLVNDGTYERLGDARQLADQLGTVAALLLIGDPPQNIDALFHGGADHIHVVQVDSPGQNTIIAAACDILLPRKPYVVFAAGDPAGREYACRIAARCGWRVASPALLVRRQNEQAIVATALDASGKFALTITASRDETLVVTLQAGVAEAIAPDRSKSGTIEYSEYAKLPEPVISRRFLPADISTANIQHLQRLIAGGRGLGSAAAFDLLQTVGAKLGAGIAASRMAVDLGWIDHERQVGQSGKTVKPQLYIACGISGASHHWEGMSESEHIISINNDPNAPIHAKAHLALVADLHEVLRCLDQSLSE